MLATSQPAMRPKTGQFTKMLVALLDLFQLGGYGTAVYEFSEDLDSFMHQHTVATVHPTEVEAADVTIFLARLRREHDWRKGDQLHLEYQKGKLRWARLVRVPRD